MQTPLTSTVPASTKPTVAFTTPSPYAARISNVLALKSLTPLWCPTITTHSTPQNLTHHLAPHSLSLISAVAFPSRIAISAVCTAALALPTPLLPPDAVTFILAALGKDAELIDAKFLLKFSDSADKITVLVPPTATPSGLVEALGEGGGRRVLCPVPRVVGLEEPPVVPDFIRELEDAGWVPIRVDAYETRWVGPSSVRDVMDMESRPLDALVFTSVAEVEGFLKSLKEFAGWDWGRFRRRWPDLVVAAHGPVTAKGAERLGVNVDVVSERFESFQGVVDAVDKRLRGSGSSTH